MKPLKNSKGIKKLTKKSDKNIRKYTKPTKQQTANRRKKVLDVMIEKGSWFINKLELARELGVTDKTIAADIVAMLKLMPAEDVDAAKNNIIRIQKKAIKNMECLADEKLFDWKVNVQATKVLIDICEKHTRTLEDYGIKEKVADKTIISGDLNSSLSKSEKDDLLRELDELNKVKK